MGSIIPAVSLLREVYREYDPYCAHPSTDEMGEISISTSLGEVVNLRPQDDVPEVPAQIVIG